VNAMSGSSAKRIARAATAPMRGYFNNHFEMLKHEVREHASSGGAGDSAAWDRIAQLENTIAELSLYQGRLLTRMSDDVSELGSRVHDLERIVRQLAAIIDESTTNAPQ
jgi:hypothetical protein